MQLRDLVAGIHNTCAAEAARGRAVIAAENLSADLVEAVNSGASRVGLCLLDLRLNASHSQETH